jgi:hypothetical protein
MKSLSRFVVLAGIFLVSAAALPAQHFVSGGFSSGYFGGYTGYGGYGDFSYGWGNNFGGGGSVTSACIIPRSTQRSA